MAEEKNPDLSKKEEKNMAVSMGIIPVLKDEAARSILQTMQTAQIKPYAKEDRLEAEKKLMEIMQKQESR